MRKAVETVSYQKIKWMVKMRFIWLLLFSAGLALMFWPRVIGADELPPYSAEISRIFYHDDVGRTIDYDFSSGSIDANSVIAIPSWAVQAPEPQAEYFWLPKGENVQLELGEGSAPMSVPAADLCIKPIPFAEIIVDGDPCDWVFVATCLEDQNNYGDVVTEPGSDVEYVKLAYNEDQTRLYILIKVADTVNPDLVYRVFLEGSGTLNSLWYGRYMVNFLYDSDWVVDSYIWDRAYVFTSIAEPGQVTAAGAFLEVSLDMTKMVYLDERFYFSGESLKILPPGNVFLPSQPDYMRAGRERFLVNDEPLDWFAAPRRFPLGVCALEGSNTSSQSADLWEYEVSFEHFGNAERQQFYHHAAVAMADPDVYEPTQAYVWASWFSGKTVWWQEQENILFLGANLGGVSWSIINGLKGYDPNDIKLDLKIQVQSTAPSERHATALYRINDGQWETLLRRALLPEQMPSYPKLSPQVWLWSSVMDELPDLTCEINTADLPEVLIPANRIYVPVSVSNIGDKKVLDRMYIDIYLSADRSIDGDDILISSRNYYTVNLFPDYQITYQVPVIIPSDVPMGPYYLIARIDANNDIGELDESDESNTNITEEAIQTDRLFGQVIETGKNEILAIEGADTCPTMFRLTGGGWGRLENTADPNVFDVSLYDTTALSSLVITNNGVGNGIIIGDLIVQDGSLNCILAADTDLQGDIQISGTLSRLVLRDVLDVNYAPEGHSIVIEGNSAGPANILQIQCRKAANLSITSTEIPISSIIATEWLNTDGVSDTIQSIRLNVLSILGDISNGITGDFEANLTLTGDSFVNTLGLVIIAGSLNEADWNISGNVGYCSVGKFIYGCELHFWGDISVVIAGALDNTQFLVGCDQATGSVTDFDPADHYIVRLLYLTGTDNSYFTNSNLAAWSVGTIIFAYFPEESSGMIEYNQLSGIVNVPMSLLNYVH
ncbi:MAG: hypothetical protein KAJ46_08100 [Sedimentisphaerales bacterium]|nr:hypothetical protein [Sedimentisphaerales bacterium]